MEHDNDAAPQPRPQAPGWYPDPFRRVTSRYWDGAQWTSRVSDSRRWSAPAEPGDRPWSSPTAKAALAALVVAALFLGGAVLDLHNPLAKEREHIDTETTNEDFGGSEEYEEAPVLVTPEPDQRVQCLYYDQYGVLIRTNAEPIECVAVYGGCVVNDFGPQGCRG